MRVDTNTNGHRQWFYFSVKNLLPGTVKFNIYRFKKKYSLFQRGLKPYTRSMKSNNGWKAMCSKVCYRIQKQNQDSATKTQSNITYYLTFEYKFQHAEDEVYFASGLPYTVSYLQERLQQLTQKNNQLLDFQVSTACKTLCGQQLKMISIQPKVKKNPLNYIIINARTHAGETSSSWVLDGMLQKIMSDQTLSKFINQNDISFKIIPMLNPDGVFVGNYRTGILGEDFNRKFATQKKQLFPQIMAVRKIVSECKKIGKVLLFLDLHGHSVLKNSFIYGPPQTLFQDHPLRNFSFVLWHNTKYFRLSSCKFKFNKDMSQTARIYFQIKQNILCYTCQISLGLYYMGTSTVQMFENDYQSFGSSIAMSFMQLLTPQKLKQFCMPKQTPQLKVHEIQQNYSPVKPQTRQITGRRQTQTKSTLRKQKHRQTCIQKINDIKKQLNEQINYRKQQNSSLSPQKKYTNHNYSLKKRIKFQISPVNNYKQFKDSKIQMFPTRKSTCQKIELQPEVTQQDQKPIKFEKIDQKKLSRQAQFKIRRKSDMWKVLPQSIRKKLGPKIQLGFTSTKYLLSQPEDSFQLQRSSTYDSHSLSTQIEKSNKQQQNGEVVDTLNIINQKFSQQYESINDSDNSSDDLQYKQKQYLMQIIKNGKKTKTSNQIQENSDQINSQYGGNCISTTVNINAFKQIRFTSIQEAAGKTVIPLRATKRQAHKFKESTYKSLGKANIEQQGNLMPQMIQKKHLNERTNKKNVRQPYFLVQIKNKNH